MNYKKHYDLLMEKSKARPCPEGYTESHHIVAKHRGGTNKKDNLVRLTAREHFIAHVLLAKHTGDRKDWYAVHCFYFGKNKSKRYISSRYVAKTREVLSDENVMKDEVIKAKFRGDNNPMRREENKRKLSIINSGENHPMWGRPHSDEHKERIGAAVRGEKNPRYDSTIRMFEHDDGRRFIGTAFHLRKEYGLCQPHLNQVIHGKRQKHLGWIYVGIVENP